MAGKAVAVAKKPAVVTKKPAVVAKAAKKPAVVAKAAKKPVAKAAKKPAVAKFNLNKLMMLIVRDAPKKGKKMMGGYPLKDVQPTLDLIKPYIISKKDRIIERINAVRSVVTVDADKTDLDNAIRSLSSDLTQFISYIRNEGDKGTVNTLRTELVNINKPPIINNNRYQIDKQIFDSNFMIIIIALCDVYSNFLGHVVP
jgi:hypothetical protein